MFETLAKEFFDFIEASLQQSEALVITLAQAADRQMMEVEDFLDRLIEPLIDEQQVQAVDDAMVAATQPIFQTLYPMIDQRPVCAGCRHYHGQSYGGNILVCGMHPYGFEGEKCPDWQSAWERESQG
jgi:hypothetical protein